MYFVAFVINIEPWYDCNKVVLHFGRFEGDATLCSDFFLMLNVLYFFHKIELLWFQTWGDGWIDCVYLYSKLMKSQFCPNVSYELVASTWLIVCKDCVLKYFLFFVCFLFWFCFFCLFFVLFCFFFVLFLGCCCCCFFFVNEMICTLLQFKSSSTSQKSMLRQQVYKYADRFAKSTWILLLTLSHLKVMITFMFAKIHVCVRVLLEEMQMIKLTLYIIRQYFNNSLTESIIM